MRTLSAIGFVISLVGLLLACYNQFGVVPFLRELTQGSDLIVDDFTIALRQDLENKLNMISILCVIIGVFSVLFLFHVILTQKHTHDLDWNHHWFCSSNRWYHSLVFLKTLKTFLKTFLEFFVYRNFFFPYN